MLQWDATSLITCAKFQVNGRLVLDYALDVTRIVMTTEVQQETVHAGLARGYPDAVEIKTRIDAGRLEVRATERLSMPFEEVLDLYGLQAGDKAGVRLAWQATDVQANATEAAVVRDLVESGYEEIIRRLHARYARGELTFRAVAAELGLSVRELYELFEQKGLPT